MATNPSLELIGPIPYSWGEYDAATGAEICERLAEGESLSSICRDDRMPSRTIVYAWLWNNTAFANDYGRARAIQADLFAEKMQEVAEDKTILPENKRIQVDVLKWRAARQNWRAWGDKVSHEHNVQPAPDALAPGGIPAALAFLDRRGGDDGDERGSVDS